jgi:hypothetical protein
MICPTFFVVFRRISADNKKICIEGVMGGLGTVLDFITLGKSRLILQGTNESQSPFFCGLLAPLVYVFTVILGGRSGQDIAILVKQ